MLFAAEKESCKWLVFFASSAALITAAGIGVLVGSQLDRVISPAALKVVAGVGFILVGAWTLLSKWVRSRQAPALRSSGAPTAAR